MKPIRRNPDPDAVFVRIAIPNGDRHGVSLPRRDGRPMPPDFALSNSFRPLPSLVEERVEQEEYKTEPFGGGHGVWLTNGG